MPPIRIVTDSTADLPEEIYQQYGITKVPLKVVFGQEIFRDSIDMNIEEFYARIARGEMSTTSQPAPGEFAEVFQKLTSNGSQVLCLTLSSQMSGTYQSACLAQNMVEGDVEVIDTRSATWGIGMMVMAAARAAAEGKTKGEIKGLLHHLIAKMRFFFLVDSLDHLERGGRIGKAQAFLGTLLNIKPLLGVKDGTVHPYEKVRGKQKGIERLVQIVEQDTGGAEIVCTVLSGGDPAGREALYQKISNRLHCRQTYLGDIGPVIGNHVGIGACGIVYYTI
ncbi:DegV family protein [Desulforamulus ruminis]|uniref:DegV family protein n=1 Tax=Desulforamulus ruminis (strain ATCC 23193 / DSM 2154 / NCIMB 8452 / DL) TaxID=696281 RepID=F6DRZ8_DESRL|nr:DegV family protein [Desulforamulus ruminis]AEG61022.1 degV family protein [Desulforamulus ruminis DSM 2154]